MNNECKPRRSCRAFLNYLFGGSSSAYPMETFSPTPTQLHDMKIAIRTSVLLTCATLLASLTPASAKSSAVDPQALAPLQRMSATLSAAKAFTFKAQAIAEVPAPTGQFITIFSDAKIALQRPNKLRALLGGESPNFDFYYDGSDVSAYAPAAKVYSTTKAPGTIDAMLSGLENETGIRFASAPLLFSNPYSALTRGLFSGIVVGPAKVDGVSCVHLAFRSPGVNWEIWIETGSQALPRRLAVTYTDRPNFPRTMVEFSHWNLSPWLWNSGFAFQPPAGTKEIPFTGVYKSAGR